MDEFDDLDSLLELENELIEDGEASHKRSRADLQSQQEAARCLAGLCPAAGCLQVCLGARRCLYRSAASEPPSAPRLLHSRCAACRAS